MKRKSAAILFLLGAWCAGTLFMWQVATQNFAVAEEISASPVEGLQTATEGLSPDGLRATVRHMASEVNRLFFWRWGWIQIPLAGVVLFLAASIRSPRSTMVMLGVMAAISILLTVYVVPETVRLGRMMDFAAPDAIPDVRSKFWNLHHLYTGLDSVKLLLGFVVGALNLRSTDR